MDPIEVGSIGFSKSWVLPVATPDLTANFPYAVGVEKARCGLTLMLGAATIESMLPWGLQHARHFGIFASVNKWHLRLRGPSDERPATLETLGDFDFIHLNKHADANLISAIRASWNQFEEDETGVTSNALFTGNVSWRPDFATRFLSTPGFTHLKGLAYTIQTDRYGPIDLITIKEPRLLCSDASMPLNTDLRVVSDELAASKEPRQSYRFSAYATAKGKAAFHRMAQELKQSAG